MLFPQTPSPARQITLGAALSLLVFGALLFTFGACSQSVNRAVVECKLNALRALPDDPMMVTPYDAVDLIHRIKACHAPDGGSQ